MGYAWASRVLEFWPRFLSYVEISKEPPPPGCEGPCLVWTGARSRGQGNTAWYGSFRVGPWVVRTHIFVCVLEGRAIPGMHVDHKCRNTLCVNGAHLEVVTPTENSRRRWIAARAGP